MDKKLPIKNIIIIAVAALGAIATFLPWAVVSAFGISQSVSGTNGDGWITFALFVAIAVLVGIKFKGELDNGFKIAVTAIAAVAAVIGFVEIGNINGNSYGMGSVGIGVYLVILAGIAAAVLPWIPMGDKISIKKTKK